MTITSVKVATGWTSEETRALVSIWSQENIQSVLDGVSRNRLIFENNAQELNKMSFEKNGSNAIQK